MSISKKIFMLLFIAGIVVFAAGCTCQVSTVTNTVTTTVPNTIINTVTKTTTSTFPSGDRTASLLWDGQNRTYIIHIPPGADSTKSFPLVIALHGAGGTADDMVKATLGGFNTSADRDGFIVVYPTALDGKWNDHRDENFSKSDDVGFISELIKQFIQNYNVDGTRVYVTGISNGSQMTMCLACEITDQIAAVAPVCYSMSEKSAALPVATQPISVLVMTGTLDPLIPWQGGNATDLEGERMLGPILSVPDTASHLAAFNQCALKPDISWLPDKDPQDGTRVRVLAYEGGSLGTEVLLYEIIGGGHTWPGGWHSVITGVGGKTCLDIDANEVIWSFFQKHSR
jgi:polyhydroxybutyrate depolymerase